MSSIFTEKPPFLLKEKVGPGMSLCDAVLRHDIFFSRMALAIFNLVPGYLRFEKLNDQIQQTEEVSQCMGVVFVDLEVSGRKLEKHKVLICANEHLFALGHITLFALGARICSRTRRVSFGPPILRELQLGNIIKTRYGEAMILKPSSMRFFGCHRLGHSKSDCPKFSKSKVYEELWVFDSVMSKKVPLEVSLLSTLKHPNIVQVLDVFENENFFQMVMERHGSGMDLFEFIDRSPKLDEPLASYIFRQVVAALEYLHSFQIVHRDIKDENIILNEKFHVKLIGFGSATFMSADWCFSTFCGTTEYCSPEVLQGNKYRGPELEMWALGVTLYTLIYGENPFFDVEETIEAELFPPFPVSQNLTHLFAWLLHRDPEKRCTLNEAANHEWTKQPVQIENYRFKDIVRAAPEEISPIAYFGGDKMKLSSSINEGLLNTQEKNGFIEGHYHRCHSAELCSQSSVKSDTDSSSWIEEKDSFS